MYSPRWVGALAARAPRLRRLGVLHGASLPDSTPPLLQLCPSLVSLAVGWEAIHSSEDDEEFWRSRQDQTTYLNNTERLFGSFCSTLRHLALEGHDSKLVAWQPLLNRCKSLRCLRLFNLAQTWFDPLRQLDPPSVFLLHLDGVDIRGPSEDEEEQEYVEELVGWFFDLMKEAVQAGRFASFETYVGGITDDFDYPQRHTRLTFASPVQTA